MKIRVSSYVHKTMFMGINNQPLRKRSVPPHAPEDTEPVSPLPPGTGSSCKSPVLGFLSVCSPYRLLRTESSNAPLFSENLTSRSMGGVRFFLFFF